MKYISLNAIVRSYLNRTARPIHYYARCLKFGADGITELLFDTLKIVNTVRIPVNEFYEAEIPADYIDKVIVGVQVGQFVRTLIEKSTINQLANFATDTGSQINYPAYERDQDWWGEFQWWGININTNGENTGGYYGLGAGSEPDTYTIVPERNVIQLNMNLNISTLPSKIVLTYLSDGSFANAASKITPYAQKTVEAYIDWQYKLNSKSYGMGDAAQAEDIFNREHRKLRARQNDLTPEMLIRIMNRHRKASLK